MHQSGGFICLLLRALFPLLSFNSNKFSLTVFKFIFQLCSLLALCLKGGADPVRERHVRALFGRVLHTSVLRSINPPHLVTVWSFQPQINSKISLFELVAIAAHEKNSTLP